MSRVQVPKLLKFALQLFVVMCIADAWVIAAAEPPADRLLDLVVIPDINGNSSAELVALVTAPIARHGGSSSPGSTLYVRDARTGASIADFTLDNPGWHTLALLGVPDGENVMIGALQQHAGGAIRVALRDAATGAFIRDIPFLDTARTAVGVAFVPNAAGPGVPRIAVLAQIDRRHSYYAGEEVIVEVRNSRNGELVRTMYYPYYPKWSYWHDVAPVGIVAIDDQDGNGSGEIAVLARVTDFSDVRDYAAVVIKDARTGSQLSGYNYGNGASTMVYSSTGPRPIGLAPVADASGDGEPEIAVLGRDANGHIRLQLKEAIAGGDVLRRRVLAPASEPLFVRGLGDVDGDGAAEVAAGALSDDGQITVDVHDGQSGARSSRIVFFSSEFEPRDLEVVADFSGNGVEELALIGRNRQNGVVRIQIRDAQSGRLLRRIKLPSPTAPRGTAASQYDLRSYQSDSGAGVEQAQVLLDGVVICTGSLDGYWDYGRVCAAGNLGSLAVGHHTFAVRVTRQAVSPTKYTLSAQVSTVLKVDAVAVDWQTARWNEIVSLATGESWIGSFEIRDWNR